MQQSGDVGWKSLVFSCIARENGWSGQHLEEATKSALKRHFARCAIFMRLPPAKFGQQLDFGPFEGDAQVKEKACRDPAQGD